MKNIKKKIKKLRNHATVKQMNIINIFQHIKHSVGILNNNEREVHKSISNKKKTRRLFNRHR